ncbi:MAG: glycosyltransferase family 4 protein [Fibrobacter sp.]|nr:glycosyltransferase family 4 protein [Fibrobacter sp.]
MCGKNKHRILFLNFWAQNPGGAEFSLIDLISETSKNNETWLLSSENGKLTEEVQKNGSTKCIVIPFEKSINRLRRDKLFLLIIVNLKLIVSFLLYVFKCKKMILKIKPDIIHANVPKSHMILLLLNIMGYSGKMIFHIREIFPEKSFALFLYSVLFPHKNTKAIAVSNAVYNSLPERIQKRTTVIYNGINVNVKTCREQFSAPRFLYLGRIVPWKKCEILIEAFARLVTEYGLRAGNFDLAGGTFYADESYREMLKNLIENYNLSAKVNLLPHTDHPETLYSSHNIFCIASGSEPFGRVIAEAQAYGMPVIAFNSGAAGEIVVDKTNGILVDKCLPENFCSAMALLIENPSLAASMGKNGQKRCRELFNKDTQLPILAKYLTENNTDTKQLKPELRSWK